MSELMFIQNLESTVIIGNSVQLPGSCFYAFQSSFPESVDYSREGALSSAFGVCLCRRYIPYKHKLLKFGKWRSIYVRIHKGV